MPHTRSVSPAVHAKPPRGGRPSTPDPAPEVPREGPVEATPAAAHPHGGPHPTLTVEAIEAALAAHATRGEAAAALGVSLRSLRRTAQRLGMAWPTSDRAPGTSGGAWSAAERRDTAKEWMRRRRATRAARRESNPPDAHAGAGEGAAVSSGGDAPPETLPAKAPETPPTKTRRGKR